MWLGERLVSTSEIINETYDEKRERLSSFLSAEDKAAFQGVTIGEEALNTVLTPLTDEDRELLIEKVTRAQRLTNPHRVFLVIANREVEGNLKLHTVAIPSGPIIKRVYTSLDLDQLLH